jgi:hypothetical protein
MNVNKTRIETDGSGPVEVPAGHYWGARGRAEPGGEFELYRAEWAKVVLYSGGAAERFGVSFGPTPKPS